MTELSAQVDDVNGQSESISSTKETFQETSESRFTAEISHSDVNTEPPMEDFGKLVTGSDGRVRIEKSFWSVFCDEVKDKYCCYMVTFFVDSTV